MDLKTQMDSLYRELPPDRIPWNMSAPPDELVALVESGWVRPCDAVDLGCGAGNYAVWLAETGFSMTGLDLSTVALSMAQQLAEKRAVSCRFLQVDLTQPLANADLVAGFDFAYDWEVLHHVFPEQREVFVANVHRMLRPGGKYFSLCFSEHDRYFEGTGHLRRSHIGTDLYFSSESEMRMLFERWFRIEDLDTVTVPGKSGSEHAVIRARMIRA